MIYNAAVDENVKIRLNKYANVFRTLQLIEQNALLIFYSDDVVKKQYF